MVKGKYELNSFVNQECEISGTWKYESRINKMWFGGGRGRGLAMVTNLLK
jgi:hypothetical protein